MKNKPKNIVLILRSGGDFKINDVYLLVSHINKYWTAKEKPSIYCYTDLVQKEQSVVGLTLRPLPHAEWKGWWSKLNLFSPELKSLRPFLYLDIDTVILGSLSHLMLQGNEETKFVTLEDFYRKGRLASGVMWVPDTAYTDKLYKVWIKSPAAFIKKHRGDQNFIEATIKADEFWQNRFGKDAVTTFKPGKQWRQELPVNSLVVCFHGIPRIPEAAKTVEWVKQYTSYAI